jgi:hypothetical protein
LEWLILESQIPGGGRRRDSIATGGLDYRFRSGFHLALEYLYNGAGSPDPEDYVGLVWTEPFTLGLVPFYGRDYLLSRFTKSLHPLVEADLTVYSNLDDGSALIWHRSRISLSDALEGVVFLMIAAGRSPVSIGLRSEFGAYPIMLGAYLTYNF